MNMAPKREAGKFANYLRPAWVWAQNQTPRGVAITALVAALLLGVSTLNAQTTFGSVVGSVKDSTGAVVPGTTITATNEATSVSREVVTNGAGDFTLAELLPGAYTVTAKLTGFKTLVRPGVEVRSNQATTVDLTMELGLVTQSVQVTARFRCCKPQILRWVTLWTSGGLRTFRSMGVTSRS